MMSAPCVLPSPSAPMDVETTGMRWRTPPVFLPDPGPHQDGTNEDGVPGERLANVGDLSQQADSFPHEHPLDLRQRLRSVGVEGRLWAACAG